MFTRLIPSMFARRILLLGALLGLACFIPAIQVFRLTVVRGEELRKEAESKLVLERLLPTHRGSILDRKGRVLALDRPSYDIAVDYPVITGRWAFSQAAKAARRQTGSRWAALSPKEREAIVMQALPEYEQQLDAMWTQFAFTAGITRDELERRKNDIKLQVQTTAANVWAKLDRREAEAREAELDRARELGNDPEVAVPDGAADPKRTGAKRNRPEIVEQRSPHVLVHGVDDRTAFAFLRLASGDASGLDPTAPPPLPGLKVIDGSAREYPLETMEVTIDRASLPSPLRSPEPLKVKVGGVATHIIGWMRERVHEEDPLRRAMEIGRRSGEGNEGLRDLGRYEAGDSVGATGVEGAAEFSLRGLRGMVHTRLDTGAESTTPPKEGSDAHLTLDIQLQARIQAVFDPSLGLAVVQPWYSKDMLSNLGQPLCGAAVVIDVDSGEVLALVTAPTFTREQARTMPAGFLYPMDEKADAEADVKHPRPGLNRAIAKVYQPGSIVKPLMLCGAVSGGFLTNSQRIACTGHFLPTRKDIYRCWIYKQFHTTHSEKFGHDLDGSDAIMGSCNIFFFELGRRMGSTTVCDWFGKFGVGPGALQADLGLASIRKDGSSVPTLVTGSLGAAGKPPTPSEAILMAIGQGPVTWTPLHAADAYATLARGGVRIPPRLWLEGANRAPINLGLDSASVESALDGLRRSVSERDGTTNHISIAGQQGDEPIFNAPGVTVWAKSGTATARIEKGTVDLNNDGRLDDVYTDHAWCVCLAGPVGGRPQYAISVVVDEAGSGGKAAGPIANQVIHALIAEGYLPQSKTGAAQARAAGLSN